METASLTDHLLEATDGDMFVRSAVADARITSGPWVADGAAIWGMLHRDNPSFAGVGDPAAAAKLLDGVLDEVPGAERASLPRGWLDHLPPRLGVTRGSGRMTGRSPRSSPTPAGVLASATCRRSPLCRRIAIRVMARR